MTDEIDGEVSGRLRLAERLADAAGAAILPHFRAVGLGAENKEADGFDPVTVADRAAEMAMRVMIGADYPNDGILGEEFGTSEGTSGYTWVLDPIDGTRGFISGTPTWGVLIAVMDADGPILGMVDQPYTGERFVGAPGGAWLERAGQKTPISCWARGGIGDAILFTTFPEIGTKDDHSAFRRVADRVQMVRYGMDCYAYALLAAGQIDLVIEAGLNAYDIQGPMAVIEAAGGIVTNWEGGPVHMGGRVLAAASRELHQEALALLAGT